MPTVSFGNINSNVQTVALVSTQPLKEMSTRNISWGYRRPVPRADKLNHLRVPNVLKSGSLNLPKPSVPTQICTGITLHVILCP